MTRVVPSALQDHLNSGVTTTCRLLRIDLPSGVSTGMTTLDRDVEYQGVTYSAANGFDPTAIATDSSYNVDNAEGYALLSTATLPGITEDMVRRGELEGATWEMLLVNYRDLSMGHIIIDAGDVGEVRLVKGMVFMPELVSYAMRLRQTIGQVDSVTCRAIFGNQQPGQLYCGVDASALWQEGAVTSVSDNEPRRVFLGPASLDSPPGRVQWLSGDNASDKLYQVEVVDGDTVGLLEPLPFDIQLGDQYRIRPDCDKTLPTCRDRWNNMMEFRGEPLIPIGEQTMVPRAES